MLVFGTRLHLVTTVFIALETILFFIQLYHFLNRPADRQRLWYLLLLGLLVKFNISNGLLPDTSWHMTLKLQYMIAYGFAYLMGAYIPFYFYKAYRLEQIRFFATWGVCLFVLLPYVVFDVVLYAINGNLIADRQYATLVSAAFGLIALGAILRAIIFKYKECGSRRHFRCELAVWVAVLPWEVMSAFAFYPAPQWLRILLANLGWLVITFLQFSKGIRYSRWRDQKLEELTREVSATDFLLNCRSLQLSERETEIAGLFREELTSREIGERLFISEQTVKTHITNMLRKSGDHNRRELLKRLLKPPEEGM